MSVVKSTGFLFTNSGAARIKNETNKQMSWIYKTITTQLVLYIMRYNVVPTVQSVDEILCGHSNESYRAVRSRGAVYNAV